MAPAYAAAAATGRRSEDEHAAGDDGGPGALGVALRALDDVAGLQDGLLEAEDLLALAPRLLGIELDAQGGAEHGRREVFGVVAGLLGGLAVAVVLGEA